MVEWLNKLKAKLSLGDGDNLIDHNYDYKTDLTLTKETYIRWTNKFFSLGPLFRTSAILAGCNLSRKKVLYFVNLCFDFIFFIFDNFD